MKNKEGFILPLIGGIISVLFIIWLFFVLIFSVKVPVGYTGIKVNMYGDGKGVSVYTLGTGRNYYNPFTSDVYTYPTFIQQKEYTGVNFQDVDGLSITSSIGMDYQFKGELISSIFENYRASSDKITNELMSTWIKSSINRASSKFKVDEIYGQKKEEFRLTILENIKRDLDEKGIIVSNIYFVGQMDLPPQVMQRINAKIEATQTAMQKENELRAVEAEAAKQIAEAKGYNEAQIIKAKADAEAIRIKSEAIKSQGGAEYVQLQAIEKWNGTLPVTTLGNNVPFINLK